jgi:hypothetical protein
MLPRDDPSRPWPRALLMERERVLWRIPADVAVQGRIAAIVCVSNGARRVGALVPYGLR